jgi:hypothetical protein
MYASVVIPQLNSSFLADKLPGKPPYKHATRWRVHLIGAGGHAYSQALVVRAGDPILAGVHGAGVHVLALQPLAGIMCAAGALMSLACSGSLYIIGV